MGLIGKARRLRHVNERRDARAEHGCRSFQSMATQILSGRASEEALEHAGEVNRVNP